MKVNPAKKSAYCIDTSSSLIGLQQQMQSWTIAANVGTGLVQIFVWFEKLSLTSYHCNSNSTITANYGEENRGGAMIHFLGLSPPMLLAQQ